MSLGQRAVSQPYTDFLISSIGKITYTGEIIFLRLRLRLHYAWSLIKHRIIRRNVHQHI
jgi:hypothetical protein